MHLFTILFLWNTSFAMRGNFAKGDKTLKNSYSWKTDHMGNEKDEV